MDKRLGSDSSEDLAEDQSASKSQHHANSKKEQKRRPKPKDGKVLFCGVCGDRALGYNFDAISCESCKAFFRRNALKIKPFVCSFDGNCTLDAHSRKFCSGCRLQKCFAIGMKKDWILDANQLQKRRQRQYNRRTQGGGTDSTNPCSSTYGEPISDDGASLGSTINVCHSTSDLVDQMTTFVWSQNSRNSPAVNNITTNSNSPNHNHNNHNIPSTTAIPPLERHSPTSTTTNLHYNPLPSSSTSPCPPISFVYDNDNCSGITSLSLDSSSNNNNERLRGDIPPPPPPPQALNLKRENTSDIYDDEEWQIKPLNPYIRENLEGLCIQYKDIFDKPYTSEDTSKLLKQPKTLDQLYNMTDVFIRRLIRFTKNIAEFRSLSADDQISLLKGGIMELFVLRSCVSFDAKAQSFKFRTQVKTESGETVLKDGGVKNSIMNQMGSEMFKTQMEIIFSLQELTGQDLTILVLIFIIQLMNPNRPNVNAKNTVAEAQERHLSWLQAYLRSRHDGSNTRILFMKLMKKMDEVHELGKASCQLMINVDVERLEPILIEIFDLS